MAEVFHDNPPLATPLSFAQRGPWPAPPERRRELEPSSRHRKRRRAPSPDFMGWSLRRSPSGARDQGRRMPDVASWRRSTVLTPIEETMIIAFRQRTMLQFDV